MLTKQKRTLRRPLSSTKKPTTHRNFSHLLSNQFGDHAAASLHYQKAIKLNPDFKEAYARLAMLCLWRSALRVC